jgi:ribosomal protein S14
MLFSKLNDFKLRQKFLKNEYKIKIQKYIFINLINKFKIRSQKLLSLNKSLYFNKLVKPHNATKSKIVRRCIFTYSAKNQVKSYNLSRSVLRNLMHFGLIPGYRKAVW